MSVEQLHKICESCKKPILPGEFYRWIPTPKGDVPVHEKCLEKGSERKEKGT